MPAHLRELRLILEVLVNPWKFSKCENCDGEFTTQHQTDIRYDLDKELVSSPFSFSSRFYFPCWVTPISAPSTSLLSSFHFKCKPNSHGSWHAAVEQTRRIHFFFFFDWRGSSGTQFICIQQKKYMLLQIGSASRYPGVSESLDCRGHNPDDSVMSQGIGKGKLGHT